MAEAPHFLPMARLLSAEDVGSRVDSLADEVAPHVDDDAVAICLLTGGIWFAADLMRSLAKRGRYLGFDALWLASYGDAEQSRGQVDVRASMQRPVAGRTALVLDDVFDSGLSLSAAVRLVREAGATKVLTAVFARKPCPTPRETEPDFVAWEAPARYLVGYGMDAAGAMRGLPGVYARD